MAFLTRARVGKAVFGELRVLDERMNEEFQPVSDRRAVVQDPLASSRISNDPKKDGGGQFAGRNDEQRSATSDPVDDPGLSFI